MALYLAQRAGAQHTPDAYDVVWDAPGPGPSASMPLGNGDIGLNVWVTSDGAVCFYISKTDAWGSQFKPEWDPWMKRGGVLMKLGEIRVAIATPGDNFRQTLHLEDGAILIQEGTTQIRVWVDANHPVIHLDARSPKPENLQASLIDWRLGDGDTLLPQKGAAIAWYHRNPAPVKGDSSMEALGNLTFGACMKGAGLIKKDSLTLVSAHPALSQSLSIYPLTSTWASWRQKVDALEKTDNKQAWAAHVAWWRAFWQRSWIYLSGSPDAFSVTRGYVLQRFVTACAGRGAYPIKFNGSIFTTGQDDNPDFRGWGGQFWFQNTRPMYWPLLMEGDWDMMRPLFRMYANMLPGNGRAVKRYYGHGGAYFKETTPFWGGLPYMGPEVEENYTNHYFTPILELSMMMLDYYSYTEDTAFARDILLPITTQGLKFFAEHFRKDSTGKYVLDPDNAIEMFWKVHDPAPDIAGLHAVLERMLKLPEAGPEDKKKWAAQLKDLPELPIGGMLLLPYTGPQTAKAHNLENPELYAIYPFRLFGLGKTNLELARNTFDARKFRDSGCWAQDPIQAALLGYAEVARAYVRFNLTRKDPDLKFPAFWASGHDYKPDEDNGGNGENGLQEMLMQVDGKIIRLMPAWPSDWNADFKLHAPYRTTVSGNIENGKLTRLIVTPASRRADVVVMSADAQR